MISKIILCTFSILCVVIYFRYLIKDFFMEGEFENPFDNSWDIIKNGKKIRIVKGNNGWYYIQFKRHKIGFWHYYKESIYNKRFYSLKDAEGEVEKLMNDTRVYKMEEMEKEKNFKRFKIIETFGEQSTKIGKI